MEFVWDTFCSSKRVGKDACTVCASETYLFVSEANCLWARGCFFSFLGRTCYRKQEVLFVGEEIVCCAWVGSSLSIYLSPLLCDVPGIYLVRGISVRVRQSDVFGGQNLVFGSWKCQMFGWETLL